MVVCTIELWPHGDKNQARPLGVINISNDGTGDAQSGNYEAELLHAGVYFGKPGNWRTGSVSGYRRSLSPYHLVARALVACGIK
jgi:hypothetical protein